MLQLSDSTNIIGTTIKCLQLLTPHFKSPTETVTKELVQLPTQDFSWVSHYHSYHWYSTHNTEWFRPNPLCCKHNCQSICGSGNRDKVELSDVSLKAIIAVYLEHQITRSRCNRERAATQGKNNKRKADLRGKGCYPRSPHLKLGVLFLLHKSSNDLLAGESFAVEVIDGEEQPCCHTNITLEQLDKMMLPKAIDSFNHNAEARVHQLPWKSKHEAAFFHLGKTRINMLNTLTTGREATLFQQQDLELESRADVISEFRKLWTERPV
uniref:Uncharacterized protein n=1 Tax=Oryza brachyantha TaxID=4533 RepID=J3MI86_ORYBR